MTPYEILSTIENLDDPELKPLLVKAFTPVGTGPVATSPHFVFIVSNIIRGMTPIQIAELTEREKKVFVTPEAIHDYTMQHIPPQVLHPHLVYKWLSKLDSLDELVTLQNLAKIQWQMVMEKVNKPVQDFDEEESRRRNMDSLRKTLLASAKLKLDRAPKHGYEDTPVTTSPLHEAPKQKQAETLDARDAAQAMQVLKDLGVAN